MKTDVRGVCLALIRSGTGGSIAGHRPRPAALGWKLENGMMAAAELDALHASVLGTLTVGATVPGRWAASAPLRALLAEYRAVRRGSVRLRHAERAVRGRRFPRPADCA